jgi:hypothetical protein
MPNPDYETLLGQIAQETNPVAKQALIEQCYVFEEELTEAEKDLFNYVLNGYIDDNPGYDDADTYVSFVGVYFNDDGDTT